MNRFAVLVVFVLTAGVFSPIAIAYAATLSLSPASRAVEVGDTFTLSVLVSTPAEAMNAASGVLTFPADLFQVTSISKAGSIFSLWAQDPSYSNVGGTAEFEGVVLNPGYTGSAGKIMAVTFRARSAGSGTIGFSNASVLANDGQGTNILTGTAPASVRITAVSQTPETEAPAEPEPKKTESVPTPASSSRALKITSVTHPDPSKWYASTVAKLSWELPGGATAVRLLADTSPKSTPTSVYEPPISSREIADLSNGIWYFHAQARTASGWGPLEHFSLRIDAEKPTVSIVEDPQKPVSRSRRAFLVSASDTVSGIDHYEFQIDGGATSTWSDNGDHRYETPSLSPGRHVLVMRAVDKAGNYASAFAEFETEGLPTPKVTDYPKEMYADTLLAIRGETVPGAAIEAYTDWNGENLKIERTTADTEGKFTFVFSEKLREGAYTFRFKAVNDAGEESALTEAVTVGVHAPFLAKFGSRLVQYLTIGIIIAACLLLFTLLVNRFLRHAAVLKRHASGILEDTDTDIHTIFQGVARDVASAVKTLDGVRTKRDLTREEERIRTKLQKSLSAAEQATKKKVRRIAKKTK